MAHSFIMITLDAINSFHPTYLERNGSAFSY